MKTSLLFVLAVSTILVGCWKSASAYLNPSVSNLVTVADCPDCGVCQQRYLPVCGEDGVTYHNACQLGCEKTCRKPGLKIVHDGECGNQLVYKYH